MVFNNFILMEGQSIIIIIKYNVDRFGIIEK